jgi:telomere length regulation protein
MGYYWIAQRLAILTSLAIAARELAGHKINNNSSNLGGEAIVEKDSASKRLPPWLKAFSDTDRQLTTPVETITSRMNKDMIQPMAASAADQLTGPNALKVRTFSSRLKNEQKGKRLIRNDLSKIVANSFFFPLTDRFKLEMEVRGSVSAFSTPILLAHYLKTLALLVNAAGPSTLSLPAITADLLALCLSPRLRGSALEHLPVLDAHLFCLLTILDVNSVAERDLVNSHGNEILEIKSWVESVLSQTDSGDSERERVHVLAAGVLVRCSEIIERYQRDIVGKMSELV